MTETHRMILDELNKAYESDPTKENEDKIWNFVSNELGMDTKDVNDLFSEAQRMASNGSFLIIILIGYLSTNVFCEFMKTSFAIGVAVVFTGILFFYFGNVIMKKLEKIYLGAPKLRRFKNFFNICKLRETRTEEELKSKYVDRNGNAIEVEKFKCDNPKDTIIVPHSGYPKFTYSNNIGTLCRAVIMQKAILPQQAQSINEKIAQVEFEKELPIAVIEMIDSCCTFNMHMFGSLYGLIKELNISEKSSDYPYVQQLINEYEKEVLKEPQK